MIAIRIQNVNSISNSLLYNTDKIDSGLCRFVGTSLPIPAYNARAESKTLSSTLKEHLKLRKPLNNKVEVLYKGLVISIANPLQIKPQSKLPLIEKVLSRVLKTSDKVHYVAFEHFDSSFSHFHIIFSRLDSKGKCYNDSFIKARIPKVINDLIKQNEIQSYFIPNSLREFEDKEGVFSHVRKDFRTNKFKLSRETKSGIMENSTYCSILIDQCLNGRPSLSEFILKSYTRGLYVMPIKQPNNRIGLLWCLDKESIYSKLIESNDEIYKISTPKLDAPIYFKGSGLGRKYMFNQWVESLSYVDPLLIHYLSLDLSHKDSNGKEIIKRKREFKPEEFYHIKIQEIIEKNKKHLELLLFLENQNLNGVIESIKKYKNYNRPPRELIDKLPLASLHCLAEAEDHVNGVRDRQKNFLDRPIEHERDLQLDLMIISKYCTQKKSRRKYEVSLSDLDPLSLNLLASQILKEEKIINDFSLKEFEYQDNGEASIYKILKAEPRLKSPANRLLELYIEKRQTLLKKLGIFHQPKVIIGVNDRTQSSNHTFNLNQNSLNNS